MDVMIEKCLAFVLEGGGARGAMQVGALRVSSFIAALYRYLDPAEFGSHLEGWQPGNLYHWEDVLFVR